MSNFNLYTIEQLKRLAAQNGLNTYGDKDYLVYILNNFIKLHGKLVRDPPKILFPYELTKEGVCKIVFIEKVKKHV